MHVVVCIVGFRNPGEVAACLDALARSDHRDFEVVICENGGGAPRDELAAFLGDSLVGGQAIEVLPHQGNLGYAEGNNVCIAARSAAQVWWILNPDTQVTPDAMGRLLKPLAAGVCDAAGGTLCGDDGRVQAYGGQWTPWLARATSIGSGAQYDPGIDMSGARLDYILGASLMFTRAFLERAGPMRGDYFLYGEEVEWCLRAKARGLRLGWVPGAVIRHSHGTTTGDHGSFRGKPRLPVYLDQRNKLHILRDTGAPLPWLCALGCLGALVLRAVKHRGWRQLGYGLSGWIAGVRNKRGVPEWLS
jgi:GT2 family glycosyltransferase